jgi:hypothetical protein
MTDDPIELDLRRGMAAQKETEERRRGVEVRADQDALRVKQERMEASLLAGPAASWHDLALKSAYLISLFAETPEGQDPRHRKLIESALDDIRRLTGDPSPDDAGPPEA